MPPLLLADRAEVTVAERLREEYHGHAVLQIVVRVASEVIAYRNFGLFHLGGEIIIDAAAYGTHLVVGNSVRMLLGRGQRTDILLDKRFQRLGIDVADKGEAEIGGVGVERLVDVGHAVELHRLQQLGSEVATAGDYRRKESS